MKVAGYIMPRKRGYFQTVNGNQFWIMGIADGVPTNRYISGEAELKRTAEGEIGLLFHSHEVLDEI